tara:strand:- start:138 stop:866 length:729 start_codon:yes stop_codon:yes gene_type:complete
MIVAITNCRSMKLDYTCSAEEMYSKSYVFRAQKDLFNEAYDRYLILSSKHGLILPTTLIEPYESIHLPKVSRVKIKGNWEKEKLDNWVNEVITKVNKLLEFASEVHFYVTNPYWSLVKKELGKNPKVKHITQQRNNPVGFRKYNEAVEMFKKGDSLNKCIVHVSTLDKGTPESNKWFYHLNEEKFWGKCHHLAKKYDWADEGALHRVSLGKNPHHKGWVIDKKLLDKLYRTDSGQWRINKKK